MPERLVPTLTEYQADTILTEAVNRGLFELDVDGQLPPDPKARLEAAQMLVGMADQAFKAGNRDVDVIAVLSIAEVDMNQINEGGIVATTEENASTMSAIADDVLLKITGSLEATAASGSDVSTELANVYAELKSRGLMAEDATSLGGVTAPVAEAVAETAPVEAAEEDPAERQALEDQLTFPIMRAHQIDPSEIASMSTEALRWVIEHPTPAPRQEASATEEPTPVQESIETTRMVVPPASSAPIVPPPTPVPNAAPTSVGLSAEREELEGKVTGPLLKIYGRGRQDVMKIGDNELRFMVDNPTGQGVTREELLAARALDEANVPAPAPAQPQTIAEEAAASAAQAVEAAPADAAFSPPADVPAAAVSTPAPVAAAPEAQVAVAEEVAAVVAQPPAPAAPLHVPDEASRDAKAHFDALVEKEKFPLPDDIEDPPRMPADMSKCTREEIYSLHARFHAVESRIGLVITHEEDMLDDLEKLLKGAELTAEEAVPVNEDGKKLTESQRSARVARDPQVQQYEEAVKNVKKTIRKMKVLQGNYHRDVERASRQMTRWMTKDGEG